MNRRYADAAGDEVIVQCAGLRVGHRDAILPPIDLAIRKRELWAVIGRNGSGKTTWFRTLLGLIPAMGGSTDWPRPEARVSYVPQRSRFDDLFPLLARDVVRMGADRGWSFALPRFREPEIIERVLKEADAAHLASTPFRNLSEGQKQRVLLARLAASAPELALLDEPTGAMDLVAEREAFQLLSKLRAERATAVIVVSHTLGMVREFADRVLFLDRESQTVVVGTPDEVTAHPVFHRSYGTRSEAALG